MGIRRTGDDDLDVVTELRLAFLADERGVARSSLHPSLVEATRAWIGRQQGAGRFHTWLAEAGGVAVGLASVVLHDLPPRPGDHRCLDGRLLNVWVAPEHRRAGVGAALVAACLAAADELGLRTCSLHATDDGRPLYERAGFADNGAWMERPVPPVAGPVTAGAPPAGVG